MKIKVLDEKNVKIEQVCDKKPSNDHTITIKEDPSPVQQQSLSSLCWELGCQLTKILIITFIVCTLCILFAFLFYNIVLANYGL